MIDLEGAGMNTQRKKAAFGIDFGTTNTRIVFYDGYEALPVSVEDNRGRRVYNIPSVVKYERGEATAFGYDALSGGEAPLRRIKWLLDKDYPIDVDGEFLEPVRIAANFFEYLKTVVKEESNRGRNLPDLTKASISVPVKYPPRARQALCKACEMANIEVESIFHEPVSALYSSIVSDRRPGIIGVFDWGGGTLDITTVKFDSEYARVLKTEGMKTAGDDFDKIILDNALPHFISEYKSYEPNLKEAAIEKYFRNRKLKNRLLMLAEQAKINLSSDSETSIGESFGPHRYPLRYNFTRGDFNSWIESYIQDGIDCLRSCIEKAGVESVNRIIMSGGTCNIPAVQIRLKQEFRPDNVSSSIDTAEMTAEGTALLTVHGGEPVFAKDMGVFLVNPIDRTDGYFRPIYRKNEPVIVDKPKQKTFVITDARREEVNLLIGDSPENILGQIDIPISQREEFIDVTFSIDEHLVLKAEGVGRNYPLQSSKSVCLVLDIPLAFKVPNYIDTKNR